MDHRSEYLRDFRQNQAQPDRLIDQNGSPKLFLSKKRVDLTKPAGEVQTGLFQSHLLLPLEQQQFRRIRKLEPRSQIAEQTIFSSGIYSSYVLRLITFFVCQQVRESGGKTHHQLQPELLRAHL